MSIIVHPILLWPMSAREFPREVASAVLSTRFCAFHSPLSSVLELQATDVPFMSEKFTVPWGTQKYQCLGIAPDLSWLESKAETPWVTYHWSLVFAQLGAFYVQKQET